MELWQDIKGFEGLYQISTSGRVKSYEKQWIMHHNVKMIQPPMYLRTENRHGYLSVALCKNKKTKHYMIHRLVAEAFIPNPENKPFINHKDFNKTNNTIDNLEWCTSKENNNYSSENSRKAALLRWTSKEHYIYRYKGKFRVMLPKKYNCPTKLTLTLEDAIKYRDEMLGVK